MEQSQIIQAALARYKALSVDTCFDPIDLNSRPNPKQLEILQAIGKIQYRWCVAGNQSGKSSTAARELAWFIEEKHPWWTRPVHWGEEPLFAVLAGQDRRMIETEIWSKKLKPLLAEGKWKEVRTGGSLQFVEHKETKNRILFLSHNDSSEKNRIHMQGYVAHYVWLDEMPSSIKILEELQRRVDARKGYFLATFTPKFRNEEIRKVIEGGQEPLSKIYKMSKLDNPLYSGNREEEIQKLDGYPDGYKNTILYGDWYVGDSAVYHFDESSMVEEPPGYHPGWRHVEASDPAMASKFGFTLWAECPANNIWYCVRADYITGIKTPDAIVDDIIRRTQGHNITRRVVDPHETWYINTAQARGISYVSPFNKSNRKGELIKNLQNLIGKEIKIAPWCTNLISEFQSCQWSESGTGRIVNSSSYHLLDTAQYFVDCKPKTIAEVPKHTWAEDLWLANKKRKVRAARKQKLNRGLHWR